MATAKKVIIPRSQLIPVDKAGETLVRFRILSDDRNRFSEWSSIFSLTTEQEVSLTPLTTPRFVSSAAGSIVTIAWNGTLPDLSLDVFISENGSPMRYDGTTSDKGYSFILSAQATTYKFSIQRSSIRKVYEESLRIFESQVLNVV